MKSALWTKRKKQELNKDLLALDQVITSYQTSKINIGDYVQKLFNISPNTLDQELVLEQFLSAYKIEASLDLNQVNKERSVVVEKLAKRMTMPEIKDLMNQHKAYQADRISFADYYHELQTLIQNHGLDLTAALTLSATFNMYYSVMALMLTN